MKTVVLIPAYNPDKNMVPLVNKLADEGLDLLIVNDGSSSEFDPLFDAVSSRAEIIGYKINRGKGCAIKYGIRYLTEHRPEVTGIITADADGQHTVPDILNILHVIEETNTTVLGIRSFTGDIPARSRFGNDLSRVVYAFVTGKYLTDNQSGLRGFPMELAPWLLSIGGSRYEYEMNVLAQGARHQLKMIEVPIETVYEDGNRTSHFKPVPDTLRIQGRLIRNSLLPALLYLLCLAGLPPICIFCKEFALIVAVSWTGLFWLIHTSMLHRRIIPRGQRDMQAFFFQTVGVLLKYVLMSVTFELLFYSTHLFSLSLATPIVMLLALTFFVGKLLSSIGVNNYEKLQQNACKKNS